MNETNDNDFTSFGPAIIIENTGKLSATCKNCTFVLTFTGYTWASCRAHRPSKRIENYNETPDWCEYKADMLRDAQDALDERYLEEKRIAEEEE